MRKIILGMIGTLVLTLGLAIAPVYAVVNCPPGSATTTADSLPQCSISTDAATPSNDLWKTVNTVINVVLAALGIATVVMIIIGGITFLTSQGDPGKVKKGKDTILYGIIGLVIALLSFAIVNFVLTGMFSGSDTADPKANAKTQQECTTAGGTWDSATSKCK